MSRPANVLQLGIKELRSVAFDKVLLGFLIWSFSFGLYESAKSQSTELRHASVARWVAANEPSWLEMSRADLLVLVEARLTGRRRHERTGGGGRGPGGGGGGGGGFRRY